MQKYLRYLFSVPQTFLRVQNLCSIFIHNIFFFDINGKVWFSYQHTYKKMKKSGKGKYYARHISFQQQGDTSTWQLMDKINVFFSLPCYNHVYHLF